MKKNVFCFACLLVISILSFTGCGKKTVKVAFCNVPESVQSSIKESVVQQFDSKIKFEEINPVSKKNGAKFAKKYDLFIGQAGESSIVLSDFAQNFPEELKNSIPDSIIKNQSKILPVLLDHYGLSYSTVIKNNAKVRYPGNFAQLEKYLKKISAETSFPLYVAGENDNTFMAFLSCFVESCEGTAGYKAFVNALADYSDLETFLKTPVTESKTIKDVLQILNDWQDSGYLIKNWSRCLQRDFYNLAEDNLVGVAFISLSQYHSLKNTVAETFACDRFPVKNMNMPHSIICPQIVSLNLSENPVAADIQKFLTEPGTQKNLSKATTLAPVENTAQPYDRQSADVRYLAAACKNGPESPAGILLFESDSEKFHRICEELRSFFR